MWETSFNGYIYDPTLTSEDTIIVNVHGENFYGISKDSGVILWSKDSNEYRHITTIETKDGKGFIFAQNWDKDLNVLNPSTGRKLWEKDIKLENLVHTPIYHKDTFFFQSHQNDKCSVTSVDAKSGKIKWKRDFNISGLSSQMVLSKGGTLYIPTTSNEVLVLNSSTGELERKFTINEDFFTTSITLSEDESKAYIGGESGRLYAFDTKTGKQLWASNVTLEEGHPLAPVISPNGNILIGVSNRHLYAFNPKNGAIKWKYEGEKSKTNFTYPPSFDENGDVYLGDDEGNIICVGGDGGNILWKKRIGKGIISSTPIVDEDAIYVADSQKGVFAISKKLPTTLWNFDNRKKGGTLTLNLDREKGILYANYSYGKIVAFKTDSFYKKNKDKMIVKKDNLTIKQGDGFIRIGRINLPIRKS